MSGLQHWLPIAAVVTAAALIPLLQHSRCVGVCVGVCAGVGCEEEGGEGEPGMCMTWLELRFCNATACRGEPGHHRV